MKNLNILVIILFGIVYFYFNTTIAQRKLPDEKRKIIKHETSTPIKDQTVGQRTPRENNSDKIKTRFPIKENIENPIRPRKPLYDKPKIKKPEFTETIHFEDYTEIEIIQVKEISEVENYEEIENPFPNFPIRFIGGELIYLYSELNSNNIEIDVYEMNISIKVRYDDYF